MPVAPIITFRAGQCEVADATSQPLKVKPQAEPGYLYLYLEDELMHFCWRKRSKTPDEPELDLVMVPTDGSFVPYEYDATKPTSKTDGRIFVLKFASSSQRYLFWLQSKSQSREGDPSWFSPRDRKIGEIVNRLLQGDEVNVLQEMAHLGTGDDRHDDDGDETMEDVDSSRGPQGHRGSGSGGAGPDATGGDIREEGHESRAGGADGARAASSTAIDANAAVRNFLASLRGQQQLPEGLQQQQTDMPYPYLHHLLSSATTAPLINGASPEYLDNLLSYLPGAVVVLAAGSASNHGSHKDPSASAVEAAKASLSVEQKRSLVSRVLKSVQFNQGLVAMTMALRDGGLPGVADALRIDVENGGYMSGQQMPLGGGRAVKAFVDGVKKKVKESK